MYFYCQLRLKMNIIYINPLGSNHWLIYPLLCGEVAIFSISDGYCIPEMTLNNQDEPIEIPIHSSKLSSDPDIQWHQVLSNGGIQKWGIPNSWMLYFMENPSING